MATSHYFSITDPRSENDVVNSFNAFKDKLPTVPPTQVPYQSNTLTLLSNFNIETLIVDRNAAVVQQVTDTEAFNTHYLIVIKLIKNMIDELNNNISLGTYPFNSGFRAHDRRYYNIAVDKESYPELNTYSQVHKVAIDMIKGEQRRIADGKPALKATTWQTLETWFNLMVAKKAAHENSFNNAKAKQKLVTAQVKYYKESIYPEMKSDAQSFYRNETKEAARGYETQWGILFREYGTDTSQFGFAFGWATYDGVPVQNAEVTIEDTELVIHTDDSGYWSTHQIPLGTNTLRCKKSPYIDVVVNDAVVLENIDKEINFYFLPIGSS